MRRYALILLALVVMGSSAVRGQSLVAETPPLSAEQERTKFHLPPGFEIQLVAHDPQVHKPMNMKFDVHGRLWVTHSLEYPFPAANDEAARDAISVFGEFAADGKAGRVARFAEHLNIPIGVLPVGDREAIAWSIPNIWRLVDSDGDGLAEKKTVMFGPFGVVDTHGDQNAFTRWIDGWVYANHGFSNDSHVKMGGAGPDVLHMNSGNTYRFRAEGSAIEQYSWGQVNPFGLCFDPLGNLYSADCHSSAVSLLLREGYYQSFGKPHDGLGYAPEITHIDHGGTGIAGVVYSTLPGWPAEYRDVLFVGNVITNRIHCDRLTWTGSTPVVTKVEDFLTCDDPWFRPVDIQPGPDGALYVADFYNCIIGHYEVPLTHPKRDRERGRIWRIVYTGVGGEKSGRQASEPMPDLAGLEPAEIFGLLRSANLAVRMLATNYLVDAHPQEAAALALAVLEQFESTGTTPRGPGELEQAAHAVWIVQRTTGLTEALVKKLLTRGRPELVQVHVARALGETAAWDAWHFDVVRAALAIGSPHVRRAAAEALAKHPAAENLPPLLALLDEADPADAQLYHQARIALRDQMRSPELGERLLTLDLSPKQKQQLVAFAVTAPTGPAAILVCDEALLGHVSDEALSAALPAAAKFVDPPRVDAMVAYIQQKFAGDLAQQAALYRALADGMAERGLPLTATLQARLTEVIRTALAGDSNLEWYNSPLAGSLATPSPWAPQQRPTSDGQVVTMLSSLGGGERLGGVLVSPEFEVPAQINFWMCGHNGLPNQPDRQLNFVRLVLDDDTEAARSYPPRDDVAKPYAWDLRSHAGRRGRIEVVDGVTDMDGFAWLAVSRFTPAAPELPSGPVGDKGAVRAELIRLAGKCKLTALVGDMATVAALADENLAVRLAATEALASLAPERSVPPLTAILADAEMPVAAREQAAEQLGRLNRAEAREALTAALKSAPESAAIVIAASLSGAKDSAAALLAEIRGGRASAALLREPAVVERLKASGLPDVAAQIDALTAELPPADTRISQLIADRRRAFLAGSFDVAEGRAAFAKSVCASCHRIGEVGKTIGPALDGVGVRGLDRLLEDTLDPSRNVDAAFRTVTVFTVDGLSQSGFGLREEGANLVLNDATGKEVRVPLADVEERRTTALSPMPTNVIEQMPAQDYYRLLAYLLSLKGK